MKRREFMKRWAACSIIGPTVLSWRVPEKFSQFEKDCAKCNGEPIDGTPVMAQTDTWIKIDGGELGKITSFRVNNTPTTVGRRKVRQIEVRVDVLWTEGHNKYLKAANTYKIDMNVSGMRILHNLETELDSIVFLGREVRLGPDAFRAELTFIGVEKLEIMT